MKTIKKLILLTAVFALIFSCSKPEQVGFDNAGSSDLNLKKQNYEMIFLVEPNGFDDTENLRNAFADAIDYGAGAVVQMVEGEYFLGFIEIREFQGKFKGVGKSKTVITALTGLDIDPLVSQNLNTFLIKFVGGDVYLSDMTIRTPEGALTTSGEWWLEGLVCFSAQNRVYISESDYINAEMNNVNFIANAAPGMWKSNCNTGMKAGFDSRYVMLPDGWPLSPTDVTVTNCLFDNFDIYGVIFSHISKGKIIAGTKNNGNVFTNNSTSDYGWGGSLDFWHNVNMQISIVDNTFNIPPFGNFGIELIASPWLTWLQDVEQSEVTVYNIEQNTFNNMGGFGCLLVNDQRRYYYPSDAPMLGQVKNNQFNLHDESFTAMGFVNTVGIVIRNNKFTGSASYGVRVLKQATMFNENGLLLGNNFSNASFLNAAVLLNPGSRNWTIVGGNLGESVLDYGENNLISGFNNNTSDVPFGQTIVDNLQDMKSPMHDLKGH